MELELLQRKQRTLDILHQVTRALVGEQSVETVVQLVTDGGRELSGAAFGAFFYGKLDEQGEAMMLYTLSGAPAEAFSSFPIPRSTAIFAPTLEGKQILRLADVTQYSDYGQSSPYFGMPPGHLPVRSYLSVPVVAKSGQVHGALFYGHPDPDIFTEESEALVVSLSALAATVIDNAQLTLARERELEALRIADERSRYVAAIVESSDDAIISKTLDGVITTWNAGAQRMFGYTAEEVIGKPVTILFPPGHLDEESSILNRIRKGARIEHYEALRMRKDGSIVNLSLSISPVLNSEGFVIGASKIARDISDRIRHEEELARSRDELEEMVQQRTASLREAITQVEEFSYTVSHDLRAPLRAMGFHAHILTEDFAELFQSAPLAWESLQRIAENCRRMDRMTKDVLAYGKIAHSELEAESVSLDEIVQHIIELFPSFQPPAAILEMDQLGSVMGNASLVNQVISNLLGNAVKFVPDGVTPIVRIWSVTAGGKKRINIKDNGIGIEPEYQHRLFGIFERIHPKLAYEGTGVGLAIVRKALDKMGGKVGVESDGKDGSLFWFELPASGSPS